MNEVLSPIGARFTQDMPPSLTSTDGRSKRVTWEVIAHRETIDEHYHPIIAEEVKLVEVEYFEPANIT